jgi:hypothetical protein
MARPRAQLIPRNFLERPRQISLVIDYLLSAWATIVSTRARIGAFGHSAWRIYRARRGPRYSRNSLG